MNVKAQELCKITENQNFQPCLWYSWDE